MEDGALIDLIDEAIHTDGEKLSDEEVLDYIEKLLEKRGQETHCEECDNGTDTPCADCLEEEAK
jgi:hypothetical protein